MNADIKPTDKNKTVNFNLAEFELAFYNKKDMPQSDKPEICFAGKSNVGKSSLINKLINRKKLARVSSRPGKTVSVNFYKIEDKEYNKEYSKKDNKKDNKKDSKKDSKKDNTVCGNNGVEEIKKDKSFRLVDLPGYGYAKLSNAETERFSDLMEYYFKSDRNIKLCFLLLDMRRKLGDNDRQMIDFLNAVGLKYAVILTKSDKLKKQERNSALNYFNDTLKGIEAVPFSSLNGEGLEQIKHIINGVL